jgi:glyoxylase-like metal-dependent hydrolase (beta-lactamase superfamily II)
MVLKHRLNNANPSPAEPAGARRDTAHSALCAGLTLLIVAGAVAAQPWKTAGGFSTDFDTVPITVERLRDNVYFMHGSGSNMVLAVGEDGALLVDNEFREINDRIRAEIAKLHPGPVRYVFNTHWHWDHTGMNQDLAEAGAVIMAHDRSRERMLSPQHHAFFDRTSPPAAQQALPVITFPRAMTLHFNGESVQFLYTTDAHTDGDAVAWFPRSNVVHMGDLYISELYPIIDINSGGDVDGYAPALDAVLAMIDEDTRVVPGHGRVGTKADLEAYRHMVVTIRDRVASMIADGLELAAILAANPSREFDPDWASDRVGPDDWVTMVYQSLMRNPQRSR